MAIDFRGLARFLTVENRKAWLFVGVVIVTMAPAGYRVVSGGNAEAVDDALRYGNALLQAAGLGVVAYGLHGIRVQFGRDGFLVRLGHGIRRLGHLLGAKPNPVSGVGIALSGIASAEAFGRVTVNAKSDAPLEKRVAALEKNLATAFGQIDDHERRFQEKSRELARLIEAERTGRAEADRELRREVEEAMVGGIDLEWMGFWWLLIGTVVGGFSKEISKLIT